jgi:hypothetical protein
MSLGSRGLDSASKKMGLGLRVSGVEFRVQGSGLGV